MRTLGTMRAVLLDAGNTITGWDLDLVVAMLGEIGIETTPARLERAEAAARPELSRSIGAGRSTESLDTKRRYLQLVLQQLGASDALESAARAFGGVSTGQLWARLLPGVASALERLVAAGIRVGVVSNSDGTIERQLEGLGVGRWLDVVVDSGAVGVEKPNPRIFNVALDALGCAPADAVHVGDLYATDVIGARAAGIRPVLLDPFGDWGEVDCDVAPNVGSVVAALTR
jgi:putative hydrolase of the HAD superfamily